MIEMPQKKQKTVGKLFIIFGPSGVGKTTIAQAIMTRMEAHHPGDLVMVKSYTTRNPRPNEQNGVDYWFISPEEFEQKQKEEFFLESSTAYQASYGSSYKEITELLVNAHSVLIVIDRYGMEQILKRIPDAVTMQILPPQFEVLRERLYKRSDIAQKDIEFRMHVAQKELMEEHTNSLAQYIVINDVLELAIDEVYSIITHQIYG